MIHEWNLSETNLRRMRNRAYEVAVLPTAAIEPHNLHLPMGQDWLHTTHIAGEACARAWKRTESILCLPALPYGVGSNLLDFPGTIHVSQAVLDSMISEIVASLRHHGLRKIVLLNGHGGNDFVPLIRRLQHEMDVYLFVCNWWVVGEDRWSEIFEKPEDHAGEMETSVAMALFPQWVEAESAGDGRPRPFRFTALQEGWVKTSRQFSRLNDVCAAGDPAGASAQKGEAYLEIAIDRIADFLVELAEAEIDALFPQQPQ